MPDFEINPVDEDAVLKEIWNIKDIDAKTELSSAQIEHINKLKTLSLLFGNELLKTHLDDFMVLQKSLMRKSMEEFVKVVKARREDKLDRGKGFFQSMMG